jgi:hypothetical protein
VSKPLAWGLLAASLALAGAPAAVAQVASSPEAVAMVFSTGQGPDELTIAFAVPVERSVVQASMTRLQSLLGQPMSEITIEADTTPDAAAKPGADAPTTVRCEVSGLVPRPGGELPVTPFVEAFPQLTRLHVLYRIAGTFRFDGPQDFDQGGASVSFEKQGDSYLYRVWRGQRPATYHPRSGPRSGGGWLLWALVIVAVSAVIGITVLIVLLVQVRRRSGASSSPPAGSAENEPTASNSNSEGE